VDRAIAVLADRPGAPLRFEVNLSGLSLGDPELLAFIERRLGESPTVDASQLIFEVTETVAVANMDLAKEFAERLSALGCAFALDDFGAGYGGFYYLKHLPFDDLKIDGEFIVNCLNNPTDRLVIAAIVGVARGLGKRTIAEFVSDDATAEFLYEHGVDFAQGYHIGHPIPLEIAIADVGAVVRTTSHTSRTRVS
jgi:EAL domain-containing protein (putative c-di-GMP-specific phosphodiesterase class I)